MEILRIYLLSKLLTNFGEEEFSYKNLKNFLQKNQRISKTFVNDVIARLIEEGDIIKSKKRYFILNNHLDDYIEKYLEKSHLERNRIILE